MSTYPLVLEKSCIHAYGKRIVWSGEHYTIVFPGHPRVAQERLTLRHVFILRSSRHLFVFMTLHKTRVGAWVWSPLTDTLAKKIRKMASGTPARMRVVNEDMGYDEELPTRPTPPLPRAHTYEGWFWAEDQDMAMRHAPFGAFT